MHYLFVVNVLTVRITYTYRSSIMKLNNHNAAESVTTAVTSLANINLKVALITFISDPGCDHQTSSRK